MPDYSLYQSPYTWRYGSQEMRTIWSEEHKRRLWRLVWTALAQVQAEFGLVSAEQAQDITDHATQIDIAASLAKEAEIHHDLMAELLVFAAQCPTGGKILHLGATSTDIEDNADAIRIQEALDLLLKKLEALLLALSAQIQQNAALVVIGFTHLQPAEPTTLGYRFAVYAQDLLEDYRSIKHARRWLRGKGFKGAVGTSAAYADLLGADQLDHFEARLSETLELPFFKVSTQTYPRRQDFDLLSTLAALGASLHKFAFDLRLLQSPVIGELAEPFGKRQVGSSAMPFKRNPINAEKIDSLARLLAQYPRVAWDNAALSLLERTLDDSANRRTILPEAFLICDELVRVSLAILNRLEINQSAAAQNLATYAPFAATERVLTALVKVGGDRQSLHETLRQLSMRAWEAVRRGEDNPLAQLIADEAAFQPYLNPSDLAALMDVSRHTGAAEARARDFALHVLEIIAA